MSVLRGAATTKDVGVFLNARHLLGFSRSLQTPAEVQRVVDGATTRLLLGGSTSHQVVVADCAIAEERRIAEDFALHAGFRVRHAPARGAAPSAVLSAEVLAAAADSGLRVVVVGDKLRAQQPTLDVLHTLGRWVVLLSDTWSETPLRHADLLLDLPLDQSPLLVAVAEVFDRLGEDPDAAAVHAELTKAIPGFRPSMFGFDSMAALIKLTRRRLRRAGPHEPIQSSVPPEPEPLSPRPGTDRALIRAYVLKLAPLTSSEVQQSNDLDLARFLLTFLSVPELRELCSTHGVDGPLFIEGLRRLTSEPEWHPTGDSSGPGSLRWLMQSATAEVPGWSVGCPPGNNQPTLIRRVEIPEGWSPYEPVETPPLDDG